MDQTTEKLVALIREEELVKRRRNGHLIGAWHDIETGELKDFHGTGVLNMETPQGVQAMNIEFPINNCKTFDEAFAAAQEAINLHVKVLQQQSMAIQQNQIAQQQMAMRAAQIQKAIGGIQIAR